MCFKQQGPAKEKYCCPGRNCWRRIWYTKYFNFDKCSILLTHWGLVTPYGNKDLCHHWLRQWLVAWRHQAITWTNVDLSSVRSSDIHLRASSQDIPQPSITEIIWKTKYLKCHSNFPGANELMLLACCPWYTCLLCCVLFSSYEQILVGSLEAFTYIIQGCFTGTGAVWDYPVLVK